MKKILGILSVFLGLELILSFVFCFFLPVPSSVAQNTIFGYRILMGIDLFIKYFPGVIITAFIVAFAVYFGRNSEGSLSRFSAQMMKRFRYVMIASLIISTFLTMNTEIFGTLVKNQKLAIENRPKIIKEYVKVGNNLFNNGYYKRAMLYAAAALKLSPNDGPAAELRDRANVKLEQLQTEDIRTKMSESIEDAEKVERVNIDGEQISQVYEYYLTAKNAFDNGKWFDAHYYAELGIDFATAKDPNYDKLKALSTAAWTNLTEYHNLGKNEDQLLFDRKYEGYLALIEKDDLKAYYIFRDLYNSSVDMHSDPDVVFYMGIAEQRINQRSFFIDETFELESFENANDVYFSYNYPDGSEDIFYCKGVTIVEETGESIQYLRDLTIMSIDRKGNWLRTMNVPYAKVLPISTDIFNSATKNLLGIDDDLKLLPYILLKSVGRESPELVMYPTYTYKNGEINHSPEYMLLPISYDDFLTLECSTQTPETIPLVALSKLAFGASEYGYSSEIFIQVFMNRIYYPLWILVIFIMLATFAWHNRINPNEYFKFSWALAFPLFFIVAAYFYKAMLFIFKLLNYSILGRMGTVSAFITAGIIYFVCLVLSAFCFLASRAKK